MVETNLKIKDGIDRKTVDSVKALGDKYKYGFSTEVDMEYAPKGISEDIVKLISNKNSEPEWMTTWRLEAFKRWSQMSEPEWPMLEYKKINYQDQYYYAKPKSLTKKPESLADVEPALLETYAKLGIPLKEQEFLAGVVGAEPNKSDGKPNVS